MSRNHPVQLLLLFCCILFLRVAVASQSPTPQPRSEEELVHFGDLIDVDILGGFEFDWRGTLTSDGYLDGVDGFNEPIYGLCRSEDEIAAAVAKAFSKILRDPKVVVRILDRSNRAVVRLDGAVRTPMRFRLKRPVRLNELLVLAGGLTDDVSGEISIFRPRNMSCLPAISSPEGMKASFAPRPDNGSETMTIKISDLLSGKEAANVQILSGDMIDVSRAVPVYVIGAVNNPRQVYSRARITVSRAVASAGGLAKNADPSKVNIFRREGSETRSIEVDLDKIKRGVTDDVLLASFDIIDVASKSGGKRKYPPVLANSATTKKNGSDFPLKVID